MTCRAAASTAFPVTPARAAAMPAFWAASTVSYTARISSVTELVPATDLLLELRRVKSREELEVMTAAQRIAERALADILKEIRPGVTEKEIAARLAVGGGGPGLLVDLHAHAVAEAVAEILFVSGVRDDPAGPNPNPRLQAAAAGALRLPQTGRAAKQRRLS